MCRQVISIVVVLLVMLTMTARAQRRADTPAVGATSATAQATLQKYCITCHNERLKTAGLTLDKVDIASPSKHAEVWEKVIRKVATGQMPPVGASRPDQATIQVLTTWLETELDRAAQASPNPGRKTAVHRLSRTEYGNAIRDLLGLEHLPPKMALDSLLPEDNVNAGFDNLADLLFMSPLTVERYLGAAAKLSALAVGDVDPAMFDGEILAPSQGLRQDVQLQGFAAGTSGGVVGNVFTPVSGEYRLVIVAGAPLIAPEQLEVSLDDERVHLFEQAKPWTGAFWMGGYGNPRQTLEVSLPIKAGTHKLALTFVRSPLTLDESVVRKRDRPGGRTEKTQVLTGERRRQSIVSVTIRSDARGGAPASTPSRDRIFVCRPSSTVTESACARKILLTLARRAYRRPATEQDLQALLPFYETGRKARGFEDGIKQAIERLLVSPQFLFRIEVRPPEIAAGTIYAIRDLDLASRLSFFLWSSIPDDALLTAAEQGRLKNPAVLRQQVQRMLRDPRAKSLVTNFAEQWLFLRDIDSKLMDESRFPNFDEGLRSAMRRETELFLESVLLDNRSVLDLVRADYTFLNERLGKHYGVPNIYGSHFRRVTFGPRDARGGLLGHGSILLMTSYGTRTSPVLRGKWILENLLASPPPPPPPNIPALAEKTEEGAALSMRQAMERHRRNPTCAGCHAKMDPLGFALENFTATGAWRVRGEDGSPIDVSGAMPDGSKFDGPAGLRKTLVDTMSEPFVVSFTEKLLKYALGRDLTAADAPVVRRIVRDAKGKDYAFFSLVEGVVASLPFQKRIAPQADVEAATSARK